jgi:type I restriction-modification system DNA methylase subunit
MAYTTYSELQTSIANYLGRSDLTSIIPDFIRFAETRLSRDLRTRIMLKSATTSMTAGDATVALPTDLFYNTGIATYIWVLSNQKSKSRKGLK